jgi:hypothetical protein
MKKKCRFVWNNGNLAILCSKCNKIIKEGKDFTGGEMTACKNAGSYYLPPQYCEQCKSIEDERNTR